MERDVIEGITQRLRALETRERSEMAGGVKSVAFAALPGAGQTGRILFVTNGRKAGEGPGAGTGVLTVDDGTNWIHVGSDTTVQV